MDKDKKITKFFKLGVVLSGMATMMGVTIATFGPTFISTLMCAGIAWKAGGLTAEIIHEIDGESINKSAPTKRITF